MLEPDRDRIGKSAPCATITGRSDPTSGLGALERLGGRRQRGRVLLCLVVPSVRQDRRGDGRSGGAPTTGHAIPSRIGLLADAEFRWFRGSVQASGARLLGTAPHRFPASRLPRRRWSAALFGRPFGRDTARGWGTDHSCCRRQAGCLARFRSSAGRTGRRATPLGCWLARIFAFGASLESFFAGCGAHLGVLGRAGRGRGAAAAAGHDDRHRQQSRHKSSM